MLCGRMPEEGTQVPGPAPLDLTCQVAGQAPPPTEAAGNDHSAAAAASDSGQPRRPR